MVLKKTKDKINVNRVQAKQTYVYVGRVWDASTFTILSSKLAWKDSNRISWSKYQIKETDMRVKTASFTSPFYFDLTTGLHTVLITSPYHEDFAGIVLKVKYNEDDNTYEYQCQDWSRLYQRYRSQKTWNFPVYNLLQGLILRMTGDETKLVKKYKDMVSGLRPKEMYNMKDWGCKINFNPMNEKISWLIKKGRIIDIIRDIIFGSGAPIDVYFNKYGVLQIEPYDLNEWQKTGLHLFNQETASRIPEFDTTNVITRVGVEPVEYKGTNLAQYYSSEELVNLDLTAFFGTLSTVIANPNEKTTTTSKNPTTTSTASKKDNPYGTKKKKVWIDADSGSCGTRNALANALRRKGWTVHVGGCGPNYHYSDYFRVSSDYQCLINIYNGFCAGTIREAYSSYIQNTLKRKGVVLIPCFITSSWTNPRGMKPYRYGDFSGYRASRAWDDNFSSSDPSISNVGNFFKKNNAKYLCYPNVDGLVTQFLAGGYFEWKKSGGR